MLYVTEIFRSLQGESTFAGLPCTFVRLSGCNLRCRYCDTRYAYEPGTALGVAEIVGRVTALGASLVEVTGGEPLLQAETPALLAALARVAGVVLLETNGSLPLPAPRRPYRAVLDLKCPGSGESGCVCWENLDRLQPGDEVKFVLGDRADFDWAVGVIRDRALAGRRLPLLFAPVAGALPPATLAGWILDSGLDARLQLQLHKILWPNVERGV